MHGAPANLARGSGSHALHPDLVRLERSLPRRFPPWLLARQKTALAHFSQRGFPTLRDEAWRYTNVAAMANTCLDTVASGPPARWPEQVPADAIETDGLSRLVFVNGRFWERSSRKLLLPNGARAQSLAAGLAESPDVLERHLACHAPTHDNPFAALNTALFDDGAFVYIPPGVVLEEPIHLMHYCASDLHPRAVYPRTLLVVGPDSRAAIVEHYCGHGVSAYCHSAVTELVAEDNAAIDYYRVVQECDSGYHCGTLHLRQGHDSRVLAHTVVLGGALVRSDIQAILDGTRAECELHGLYVLRKSQHSDIHLRVEHRAPHGSSREHFRGVLEDRARGIFSGRIVVYPGAQKTDAKQSNHNLLLSEDAQVNSDPQLEIRADDVKCTHAATAGQIDEDALFYLRSRGLGAAAARSLLVYAFAQESLSQVRHDGLRAKLEALVLSRLPHGELLRGCR